MEFFENLVKYVSPKKKTPEEEEEERKKKLAKNPLYQMANRKNKIDKAIEDAQK